MIKTIKVISGVGKFSNYDSKTTDLEHEFTKFNVIYGLNTYGKTTICDIFKDINDDVISRTIKRKTLPKLPNQTVVINCGNQKGKDSTISLSTDYWNSNSLKESIYVFDSEFMYKNVFSGLSVIDRRETKENFTDFILGAEGVLIASDLETSKRSLKQEKEKLQTLIPPSQAGKKDKEIQQYVEQVIADSDEVLQEKQTELIEKIEQVNKKSSLSDEILASKGISSLEYTKATELIAKIGTITDILMKSYHISSDTVSAIEAHISSQMNNYPKATQWLQIGYTQIIGCEDICPFCGQSTKNNMFIQALSQYFNIDYQEYIRKINEELSSFEIDWAFMDLSSQILLIERQFDSIEKYDCRFNSYRPKFAELHFQAEFAEAILSGLSNDMKKALSDAIETKRATPQTEYAVDYSEFIYSIDTYCEVAASLAELVRDINTLLTTIQIEMNAIPQIDLIGELSREIESIKAQRTRLAEETLCKSWNDTQKAISGLAEKVRQLSTDLEENQQKYLDDYFCRISELFNELGARDFKINVGDVSNKGLKKVYGISIAYKGVPVTEQTQCVFSESDRRALALAIFIAKIEKLAPDKKDKAIVVFDDPATSFDDNRIIPVISSIYQLTQNVLQVFIFAHHYNFVYNISLVHKDASFFKIKPITDISNLGIYELDLVEEFGSEIHKQFIKLSKFNAGGCERITPTDLRIFMETYLDTVFHKQYCENNMATLQICERIDKYLSLGVITEAVALKLHDFRKSFNPGSHLYLSTSPEEIRTVSCCLIDFLFDKVHLID